MPMLISNPFNDHSRDFLVGNELGESYKVVRTVYDNLGALRHISEDPKIQELAGSVSQVSKVAENIDAILRANETLTPELVEILPTVAEKVTLALSAAGRAETAERNALSSAQATQLAESNTHSHLNQVTKLHQQINTDYADIKAINQNLLKKVTQVQGIYDVLSPKVDAVLQNHKKIEALAQQVTEDVAHVDMVQGQVDETALQVQTHAQEVETNWLASKEQASIIDTTSKQVATDKVEVASNKDASNVAMNKAKAWATNAEDVPVELGAFSALHHATKAKKDAQQVASNTLLVQEALAQCNKDTSQVAGDLVKVTSLRDEVIAKEALVQSAVVEVNLSRDTVLEQAQQVQSNTEAVASNTQQVATNTQAVATNLAKAKEWASKDQGELVDVENYSAKHYALEAKGYANQATQGQVQSDWLDDSLESKGYIKNKPALKALALKDTITTEDIGTGVVTLNTLGSDVKAKLVEPSTFDDLKADIITAITQAGVLE